jgi:hypothetical protein
LSDWYAVEGVRCWVDVYCIKGTELDGQQSAKRNREQRRNGFHNIRSVVTSKRAGEQQRGQQETTRKQPTTEKQQGNSPQQRNSKETPTTEKQHSEHRERRPPRII